MVTEEEPKQIECTLAWVEERVAEIKKLREELNGLTSFSKGWHETNDELNARISTLHANIIHAIAYGRCVPDAVTVCQAAGRLS